MEAPLLESEHIRKTIICCMTTKTKLCESGITPNQMAERFETRTHKKETLLCCINTKNIEKESYIYNFRDESNDFFLYKNVISVFLSYLF